MGAILQHFPRNLDAKSEIQRPKSEGNPKLEIRNRPASQQCGYQGSWSVVACPLQIPKGRGSRTAAWPLRISDFELPSGFGLRISGFCHCPLTH
jgi:hypothetical protein